MIIFYKGVKTIQWRKTSFPDREKPDIHIQMSEVVLFFYIIQNNDSKRITDNNVRAKIIKFQKKT